MSISGVGQNYYQNNVTSVKNKKNMNGTEETGGMRELTEAEEMAAFKKEFYAELDRIPRDRTIANVAVNISEEAFKNMKADPKYREQMLSVIRRDMTGSVAPAPDCSLVITVGATAKDYRADGWSVNNDSEFYARSQDSFFKKTSGKKDRNKELLEEYLKKRVQAKRQQQELLACSRICFRYSSSLMLLFFLEKTYLSLKSGRWIPPMLPVPENICSVMNRWTN